MPKALSDLVLQLPPAGVMGAVPQQYVDDGLNSKAAYDHEHAGTAAEVYVDADDPGNHGYNMIWADPTQQIDKALLFFDRIISVVSTDTTAESLVRVDYVYVCTAALTLTMPTAAGNKNLYTVKRVGTGNVTVATSAAQTIDGASTFVLGTQYMAVDLISDGSNWVIV